jgi:hypothetical protein
MVIVRDYFNMTDEKKIVVSRWLIFFSFTLALLTEIITTLLPDENAFEPHSSAMTVVSLCLCALFVSGLYLGSRALGVPLTAGLFFQLIFSAPNRYIFVPYLFLVVAGILYLELFY